jgi:hypothetical protein
MERVRTLLRSDGTAILELEGAGVGVTALAGRLETPSARSRRFRWGRVGVDGLDGLAAASGFAVRDLWQAGGRHFAELDAR